MAEVFTSRQHEIMDAAGYLLAEFGINGLTTKNLSRQLGISEPAIYRHFASKENIIVAMLDHLAHALDTQYAVIASMGMNPEEHFLSLFQEQFRFFSNHPHYAVAIFSDGLLEESPLINAAIQRIMAVKVKHLTPLVEVGQSSGYFITSLPASTLIHVVMGSIRLKMFQWRVARFQPDLVEEGHQLAHSLLTLMTCKP
jgi:AcrR family transcriptional regulator